MRLLLTAIVLIGALLASVGHAAEPILIRFSHVTGENTPKGQGAELLKRLVEERLAGKVRVVVYPRSVKFTDDQALLSLLFGDIELAAPSFSKLRSFSAQFQVFDLPFLFDDVQAVHRFQASAAGQELMNSLGRRGLKGLAYWDNGMRAMSANRPLRTPEDVRGLRFRIEPSAVMWAQYQALGATAVAMPFKQVREALKLGLVSGQENAWSNIRANQFDQFQSHITDLGHTFLGYLLVTSAEFWGGLPPDIRRELEQIIVEVTAEVNRTAAEKARRDRQAVVEMGRAQVLTLTDKEREAWRAALQPIWARFTPEIGDELMKAAIAAGQ